MTPTQLTIIQVRAERDYWKTAAALPDAPPSFAVLAALADATYAAHLGLPYQLCASVSIALGQAQAWREATREARNKVVVSLGHVPSDVFDRIADRVLAAKRDEIGLNEDGMSYEEREANRADRAADQRRADRETS